MTKNDQTVRKAFSTLDITQAADEYRRAQEQMLPMSKNDRNIRDLLRAEAIEKDNRYTSYNPFLPYPSPAPKASIFSSDPKAYAKPFCDFLTNNPTVFHAVANIGSDLLKAAGFTKLSERDIWNLKKGGKYYVERNGSSLIAFEIGAKYQPGNGVAMLAGHVDALTAKLKPVSQKSTVAGYDMLGVAPYAGALNKTWWDRDLGVGGRVLVKESSGKIVTKLVKLDWPSTCALIALLAIVY